MTFQIDAINHVTQTSQTTATLNLTENSIVRFLGNSLSPNYPRLVSHEAIMIRTLAIADNLDEVMMLPQNMVFPLRTKLQPPMRRKVNNTKGADSAHMGKRKRNQEDEYEDLEEYD